MRTGLLVCPGLIDMHTHGIMDVSFMDSDVPTMVRGLAQYAAYGVTRVVASTLANPYEVIISQIARMRAVMENRWYGAMLHGAHMEGPWLAPRCRGGHDLRYLRVPEKADVQRILGEVGDVIRTVTYAPELPGSRLAHGAAGMAGASCPCWATRRPATRRRARPSLPAPGT